MNELSKNLKCICLRNGVELWVESDRLDKINFETTSRFLRIDDEIINTADIVGIFTAETMDAKTRRQNGAWQCRQRKWHDKKEKCECLKKEEIINKLKAGKAHLSQYGFYPTWFRNEWFKESGLSKEQLNNL